MPDTNDILVVDDEELICFVLTQLLKVHGYSVRVASRGDEALDMIAEKSPSLVILDIRMPGLSGFDVLHRIRSAYPDIPVILMTALSGVRDAVDAMKSGAFDYVAKPFDNREMIATVERALREGPARRMEQSGGSAPAEETLDPAFHVLGPSAVSRSMALQAQRLARGGKPCLIRGEIGAGKQMLVRIMHGISGRPGSLVELHCTGATESILRHELYGSSSTTGPAIQGKIQLSQDGTLAVSGIEDAPAGIRDLLARDFGRGYFSHPFTGASITLSGSLILTSLTDAGTDDSSAIDEQTAALVENRILDIPPLRDRREDIPHLVGMFMEEAAGEFDKEVDVIDDAALQILIEYEWPGNVHQLKALIRRAVLTAGERIAIRDIDLPVPGYDRLSPLPPEFKVTADPLKEQVRRYVGQIEREVLLQTLQHTSWNKSRASRLLGITYKTMLKKIAEYGLESVKDWR